MVYRGIDAEGNIAALKTQHPDRDGASIARLLVREAEIVRELAVKGVPQVLGTSTLGASAQPFVAFELVDGPNLHDVLQRRGPLPDPMRCSIAEQLVVTLQGVHEAPAVHGDVKPANLILGHYGLMLVDFGAAVGVDAMLTRLAGMASSGGWLAPELLEGCWPSAASDVFGWAATVAICGGEHSRQTDRKLFATLPARFKTLLAAALEPRAADRPTAAQAVSDLGLAAPTPAVPAQSVQLTSLPQGASNAT